MEAVETAKHQGEMKRKRLGALLTKLTVQHIG